MAPGKYELNIVVEVLDVEIGDLYTTLTMQAVDPEPGIDKPFQVPYPNATPIKVWRKASGYAAA